MRVLITEARGFNQEAVNIMEEAGIEVVAKECDREKLKKEVAEFDGVVIRLGIKLDEEMLSLASRLKFIASTTTGLDHIDLAEAERRGIKVISLKGEREWLENITPTAELAIALMLVLNRRIASAIESVKEGSWDRDSLIGHEMKGKIVGIVGMGRLGAMVARLVSVFGAKVVYFDPFVGGMEYEKVDSIDELARQTDIVSVHVPLSEETRGLINEDFIDACGRETIIINTSRGEVIDEEALLEALREKRIGGAGLDVLRGELDGAVVDSKLIAYAKTHNNVIVTPHVGGATVESMQEVEKFICQKVVDLVRVNKLSC